jgi:hypothetical protein
MVILGIFGNEMLKKEDYQYCIYVYICVCLCLCLYKYLLYI